jgi:hypothetical protein
LRAAEWNEREIVRGGKLRDTVAVPMAKLAYAGIAGERDKLPGEDCTRFKERRLVVVP